MFLKRYHELYNDVPIKASYLQTLPINDKPECLCNTMSHHTDSSPDHSAYAHSNIDSVMKENVMEFDDDTIIEESGVIDLESSTNSSHDS